MTTEEYINKMNVAGFLNRTGLYNPIPELVNILKPDEVIKQPDLAINASGILQPVSAPEQKAAVPDLTIPELNAGLHSAEQMDKIVEAVKETTKNDLVIAEVNERFKIAKEAIPELSMGYTPDVLNPIIDKIIEDSKANIIAIHPEITTEALTEMTGDSVLETKQLSDAITKDPKLPIKDVAQKIVVENNQRVEAALIEQGLKEAPVPAAVVKQDIFGKLIDFIYNKLYKD